MNNAIVKDVKKAHQAGWLQKASLRRWHFHRNVKGGFKEKVFQGEKTARVKTWIQGQA